MTTSLRNRIRATRHIAPYVERELTAAGLYADGMLNPAWERSQHPAADAAALLHSGALREACRVLHTLGVDDVAVTLIADGARYDTALDAAAALAA